MTSMDDVIAESGLSAGALYRYFPGKDALIRATIDETLDLLLANARAVFADAVDDPTIGTTAERLLTMLIDKLIGDADHDISRIALYAWAEAPRNPIVAEALTKRYVVLRAALAEVARVSLEKRGVTADSAAIDALGRTLLAVLLGFITQRILLGDIAPSDIRTGLDTLGGPAGGWSPRAH